MRATPAGEGSRIPTSRRALAIELVSIVLLRLLGVLALLGSGFRAISDDDYARTVIAQRFVGAPKLDPSGTSWLPFPFHAMGTAMVLFGRSIEVARWASVVVALLGGVVLHLGLVAWRIPRPARLVGAGLVAVLPWTVWTTAATVPEASTAAFVGAAILLAALPRDRATPTTRWAAAALVCAATLSRYEAWPAAIVVACALAAGAGKNPKSVRVASVAAIVLALGGAVAWMAWNKVSHGSATHFLFRVARFKKALESGQPEVPLGERLFAYPRLFVVHFPEGVAAAAVLLGTLRRDDELRRARVVALGACAGILAFLVYGNLNDGAPTHHAERALLGAVFCVVPLGVASFGRRGSTKAWAVAGIVLGLIELGHGAARERPGGGAADRTAQLARGKALRGEPHLTVTPCTYEHFALIAAFGAPENVDIQPSRPTNGSNLEDCPRITERP